MKTKKLERLVKKELGDDKAVSRSDLGQICATMENVLVKGSVVSYAGDGVVPEAQSSKRKSVDTQKAPKVKKAKKSEEERAATDEKAPKPKKDDSGHKGEY